MMARRHGMDPRSVRLDPRVKRYVDGVRFGAQRTRAEQANEAAAEAHELAERRRIARMMTNKHVLSDEADERASGPVGATCARCGVREDAHPEFGCRKWCHA